MKIVVQIFSVFVLLIPMIFLSGQDKVYYKYWIEFTDKDNTPFSTDQPQEFLSERALQRRAAHAIQVMQNDLPVDPAYVEEIESTGGRIIHRSRWFNAVLYETTDSSDVDKILQRDFVSAVHMMYRGHFSYFAPVHADKKSTVDNFYNYGSGDSQINRHNGQRLHNEGYRGKRMMIAILDGGFGFADGQTAFDSLRANNRIVLSKDFVHKKNNVYGESTHGTWVLSIIGANIPGQLVGTAPEADFLLLRSEDVESEWRVEEINWIVAAEFADSAGADVINASLAYSLFDLDEQNYSTSDMDGNTTWVTRGADLAARKGMLVVVSAGNSGDEPWRIITAPADGDSVLTVGAVDSEGAYVSFSSQGPTADDRVKPNVMAQGRGVYIQKSNGEITARGGTSFSAPIMTGLATCLWQR
ncbi:MAG: S8 family serine peptidase, partial [Bacteroidales bacterium]|nr:S8 family serine peptidase [Bacteroidales bacterium]